VKLTDDKVDNFDGAGGENGVCFSGTLTCAQRPVAKRRTVAVYQLAEVGRSGITQPVHRGAFKRRHHNGGSLAAMSCTANTPVVHHGAFRCHPAKRVVTQQPSAPVCQPSSSAVDGLLDDVTTCKYSHIIRPESIVFQ